MKISLKWIAEYLDISDYMDRPQELGEVLTRGGLEVEEMQNPAESLKNVFVGHILEKDKHPNADKLSLCRVTTGSGSVHQIVCGAQNHKAGDRVIVALPGAVLPGNFVIKKSAIRSVESSGMLCSMKELGLAGESEGIAILPEEAPVGELYAKYAGLDDVIFELKVTPNRADCLSHYGLARELGALLGRPVKAIEPQVREVSELTSAQIQVEVKAQDLCPRYTGRWIRHVKVGPSPDWLVRRLEKVGMSSINNIVDCTNYVMMELGQPLHAFDGAQILQKKIIIDRAKPLEKFVTLDGTELTLAGEELCIRDVERVLCLAGTIGGKNSGVTEKTTDIFLESAYFLPMSVRRTSRKHGAETDSAYRFSRGVDPRGALLALNRATELIQKVASGSEALTNPYDISAVMAERKWTAINADIVSARLGYPVQIESMIEFFKNLGCEMEAPLGVSSHATINVRAPSYRFDIEQDMDLVEEYARMYGYDKIPETVPSLVGTPSTHDPKYDLNLRVGSILRSQGFSQAWNFAFVGDSAENQFLGSVDRLKSTGLNISAEKIKIMNPLNEDLNVMRSSLVFSLAQNAFQNFHRGNAVGRLYEVGSAFAKNQGDYAESARLGLMAWGFNKNLWDQKARYPLVFEIKSAIECLLQTLNIRSYSWKTGDFLASPEFIHGGQWAELMVFGEKVGFIGSMHPALLEEQKIRAEVALGEINLDVLLKNPAKAIRMEAISKFPSVERDFAFLMPKELSAEAVQKAMKKSAGPLCVSVEVFDVFNGEGLPEGKKSVAFSMKLQDMNGTLQESTIAEIQSQVLKALQDQFALSPR